MYESIVGSHLKRDRKEVKNLYDKLTKMERIEFLFKLKNGDLISNDSEIKDLLINLLVDNI